MKTMFSAIIFILTGLFFGACKDSDSIQPDRPVYIQDTVFEMLWATRMDFEKEIVGTDNTQHYKDWMLAGGDIGDPPTIMAFNKDTGEKDWEIVLTQLSGGKINLMQRKEELLLARNGHHVFAVNLDTRDLQWNVDLKARNTRLGQMALAANDKLYIEAVFAWRTGSEVQYLIEFDIWTGDYRTVYEKGQDSLGRSRKAVSPPAFGQVDQKNILVFNEYPDANLPPQEARQNIVALDLDSDSILWRTVNFTEYFYSNLLQPPVIYDNRIVITGGDWSIYAFDLRTGEQLWRYAFDYPWAVWTTTNHLIYEDMLYVNNSQRDVTCLNPESGELIWNNPEGGSNCTDNMVYYEKEDYLVFTSWGYASVMVLDALTGETIHRERKFDNSSYNNDVVYDEERDMFFTSSYKHAIGFKVRGSE